MHSLPHLIPPSLDEFLRGFYHLGPSLELREHGPYAEQNPLVCLVSHTELHALHEAHADDLTLFRLQEWEKANLA